MTDPNSAAIYGVPWIPSIYPSHVSIEKPAPLGSVMGTTPGSEQRFVSAMSQHICEPLATSHVVAVPWWASQIHVERIASVIKPVLFLLGCKTTGPGWSCCRSQAAVTVGLAVYWGFEGSQVLQGELGGGKRGLATTCDATDDCYWNPSVLLHSCFFCALTVVKYVKSYMLFEV